MLQQEKSRMQKRNSVIAVAQKKGCFVAEAARRDERWKQWIKSTFQSPQ
jgi:DNA polymerase III delta subunit